MNRKKMLFVDRTPHPAGNHERQTNRALAPFASVNFLALIFLVLTAGASQSAAAASLCVNPSGTSGCYSTIGAAVAAASSTAIDTIKVWPGRYPEDVIIGKSVSLVGMDARDTIIDATNLSNGIYVDGADNPGLNHVVISGFTVRNAMFEGILVTSASFVTIWANRVAHNDRSLDPAALICPGLPSFERGEGTAGLADCGEGIHFSGVHHSTITNNIVEFNAGGILLSDEMGATHENLITGNVTRNNPFASGITLASFPPASGADVPVGISRNTIARNQSVHNGYRNPGAGIGLISASGEFVPPYPFGGTVSNNSLMDNELRDNGAPGILLHSFGPGDNLSDNLIVGNRISGNGADAADAAVPGPTGISIFGVSSISGANISQNEIRDEKTAVAINTNALVQAHLNNFFCDAAVIDNLTSGMVDATENWWASRDFDDPSGAVQGSGVLVKPALHKPFDLLEDDYR